jgi:hypothetical protein
MKRKGTHQPTVEDALKLAVLKSCILADMHLPKGLLNYATYRKE